MIQNLEFIKKMRSFNRFYTNIIGLLNQNYLDSPFSLTEGRVLYEINHLEDCSAKKIRSFIDIDEGYLSRIIEKFLKLGLIEKTQSVHDRRMHMILPTAKGQAEFLKLNESSDQLIFQITEKLSTEEKQELVFLMERICQLLGPT